jgi:hypothetical protein
MNIKKFLIFPGVRMLDGKATDALEASGLSFGRELIDVYVNCWGPKDDGKTFGKPGPLAGKALREGATMVSNYTCKNAQVVTNLQQTCSNAVPTTCQQDVFALLVPTC